MLRRQFIFTSVAAGTALRDKRAPAKADSSARKALVAITMDLEMVRHYPTWDQTHWDYEKGNLDKDTKEYSVQLARRVRKLGGVIHFFVVGRVLEQENVDWLKEIVQDGHPVGNHTYDHVNIRAKRLSDIQYRFRRAPWLIQGKEPIEVIVENINMTTLAMKHRLGVEPRGFRSPGGFPEGLSDFPAVQQLLLSQGFKWASTKSLGTRVGLRAYSPQFVPPLATEPSREVYDRILRAQGPSQPSVYPSGLIEIPMCPVSDLIAFRTGRWRLEHFLKAIGEAVERAIQKREVFVFLGHPACLCVTDPEFQVVELICRKVRDAGNTAEIVDMDTVAQQVNAAAIQAARSRAEV